METNENFDPVIIEQSKSDALLVIFGGIKQGVGLPIFEFRNVLKNIKCDKVFVRDQSQAWYHKGLDFQTPNLSMVKDLLQNIISANNYKQVIFLGNSMGGYAAILFGSLLGVSSVVSFSPQSFIGRITRYYHKDKRWKEQISNVYKNNRGQKRHYDLKYVLNKTQKNLVTLHIYYSTNHRLDKIHAERLSSFNNVVLHPYDTNHHNLVKELRDRNILIKILEGLFK